LVGIRAAIVTVRREEDGSDEMDPRVGEKARARVRGEKLSSGSAVGLEMGRKGGFQSSRVFLFFYFIFYFNFRFPNSIIQTQIFTLVLIFRFAKCIN
jgi:hypothetical protein